jgi:hypothetical protein
MWDCGGADWNLELVAFRGEMVTVVAGFEASTHRSMMAETRGVRVTKRPELSLAAGERWATPLRRAEAEGPDDEEEEPDDAPGRGGAGIVDMGGGEAGSS